MITSVKEFENKISTINVDVELQIDIEHTIHSFDRKFRHDTLITDRLIRETIDLAMDDIITAIIKDYINVKERVLIYNSNNDLNIVGSLSFKSNDTYSFTVITAMIEKNFYNKFNTFKITI